MKSITFLFLLVYLSIQSVNAKEVKLGIGGIYGFENETNINGYGIQIHMLYSNDHNFVSFLSTYGYYRESSFDGQASWNIPYTIYYLNKKNSFLLPGEYSLEWFELSPIFKLYHSEQHNFSLSTGLGFGLYYPINKWSWNTHNSILASRQENGIHYFENDFNTHLGYNFRSILLLPITNNSSLNIEAKYVFYSPTLSYEIHDLSNSNSIREKRRINLNTFYLSCSLSIIL
ncbi:MAG: hypothetical protein KAS18_09730 [Calditrichia bacterium]|nr:hypothetical protein [Calditrichia bacterium]